MSKMDEVKGRAKEAAGAVTGDDKLKHEGTLDRAAGKLKGAVEEAKDKLEDAKDKIEGALHKDSGGSKDA